MYNITLKNNKVFKIYDSEENSSQKILTLRFSPDNYSFDTIKSYFSQNNIADDLKRIIKTADDASYIATFNDYTSVQKIGLEKVSVSVNKTEEISSQNEAGETVTTSVPTTETTEIELIIVTLSYVDPLKAAVDKLDNQINPTVDVDTCSLDELKKYRQTKNKEAMNDFFRKNPMKYIDGLYYGVEDEDRAEMTEEYLGYTMDKAGGNTEATLEWHSKGSACTVRTEEEFAGIAIAVRKYTKPYFNQMQSIKEAIFAAQTKEEVMNIKLFGEE